MPVPVPLPPRVTWCSMDTLSPTTAVSPITMPAHGTETGVGGMGMQLHCSTAEREGTCRSLSFQLVNDSQAAASCSSQSACTRPPQPGTHLWRGPS
jgi:hypothetical protein